MGKQLALIDTRPIVEVVDINNRPRVQVRSEGFNPHWFVAFPADQRTVGAVFAVDRIVEIASRHYYRAAGHIERIR